MGHIMRFDFIMAVWGKEHVDMLLEIALPNLLTPGNLLAFRADNAVQARFKIFTCPNDSLTILNNRFVNELREIMPVEIIKLDALPIFDEYKISSDYGQVLTAMTRCHSMAISSANSDDAILIFLGPDAVFSEGTMARTLEIARSGKRVVAIPWIRVTRETFAPALHELFCDEKSHITAPARLLVGLALEHLHPISLSLFIDSMKFYNDTTHLYWKMGCHSVLMRCLNLHPLMIWPENKDALPMSTIDGDYLNSACNNYDDYHVVSDSDEIISLEISPLKNWAELIKPERFSMLRFAEVIKSASNKTHREFLQQKVIIHSGAIRDKWHNIEKESDQLVNEALFISGFIGKK